MPTSSASEKTVPGRVPSVHPRRRRHFRFEENTGATLSVGRKRFAGRLGDVCQGGARLIIEKALRLENGQPVAVTWKVPEKLSSSHGAGVCSMRGTVVRAGAGGQASTSCVVSFDRLIHEERSLRGIWLVKSIAAIAAVSLGIGVCLLKVHNVVYFWYDPWLQAYTLAAALFVLSRVALAHGYKTPRDNGFYPTVTMVVAAKNEEAHIAKTIEHCFASNYPPDLIEVIAVDDGSTDRTWEIMERLHRTLPRFTAIRFGVNKGKRHAMAIGAEKARGDVLVYVDSDSYVHPDSLYRIVQPFLDPEIGAVSGHVLAAVEENNFISKMESVRYHFSHRVMKAAESVFGAVTCCPGAFSAYRRSVVMSVLPAWLNQTFWGVPATFGDDRSLTNYVLRDHKVIYHAGATCVTYVPKTLSQYVRQQLRWKKSWARETTVAVRLMYKKHPLAAFFYYLGVVLTLVSPFMALRALVYLPLMVAASPVPYILGILMIYLFQCFVFLFYTQSKYWYYGLAFAGLYTFFLAFQNYYAIATVHKNHWGTR